MLPIFGRRLSRDPFGRKLSVVASDGTRGKQREWKKLKRVGKRENPW